MSINYFCELFSLKKQFDNTLNAELRKISSTVENKNRPLSSLPQALINYLKYCGYNENDSHAHCHIKWKSAHLKMEPGKDWLRISCDQFNFIDQPARIVYMKTKLWGLLPLDAIDKFQNGRGSMLIKLLKYFTISHVKGPEMDVAELVTILAEAMLVPAYFFQPYITWTEINAFTLKGTIKYGTVEASGIFYFNEHCELLRFETNDRYYTHNGKMEKFKWTAYAWNYKNGNGFKYPSNFIAVWGLPTGDYTYFKGRLDSINFL